MSSFKDKSAVTISEHSRLQESLLAGMEHRTTAGRGQGLRHLEIWVDRLSPHTAPTPVHYHECDEAIVVLRGHGALSVEGEQHPFGEQTTLVIPAGVIHQLKNTGSEDLSIIAAFSETPARAFDPDGNLIPLPWQDLED